MPILIQETKDNDILMVKNRCSIFIQTTKFEKYFHSVVWVCVYDFFQYSYSLNVYSICIQYSDICSSYA